MFCYVFLWKLLSFATINNQRSSIQLVASQKSESSRVSSLSVSDSADKVQDKSWSRSYLAVPLDVWPVQPVLLVLLFGHHFWELQPERLKTIIISRLQHNCSGLFRDKKAIKHRHYKVQILVKICQQQKPAMRCFTTSNRNPRAGFKYHSNHWVMSVSVSGGWLWIVVSLSLPFFLEFILLSCKIYINIYIKILSHLVFCCLKGS